MNKTMFIVAAESLGFSVEEEKSANGNCCVKISKGGVSVAEFSTTPAANESNIISYSRIWRAINGNGNPKWRFDENTSIANFDAKAINSILDEVYDPSYLSVNKDVIAYDSKIILDGKEVKLPKPPYKFAWNHEVFKSVASQVFPDLELPHATVKLLEVVEALQCGLIITPNA